MNLEESDRFAEAQEQNAKKQKIVLISIVLCAILLVLLIIFIIYIQYLDSLELKLYVDGEQKKITETLFTTSDNTNYVNVKEISNMLGYTYTKGEYGKYNEDEKSCYVGNDLELAAITADETVFTKYIQVKEDTPLITAEGPFGTEIEIKSENDKFNTFTIEKPIKFINNEIYIPFDILRDVYNVRVDVVENKIKIYTLPTLFKEAIQQIGTLGYTSISGTYENIRAIPYGLIVVGKENLYGVIDTNQKGKEILSVKYENLEFIQNSQEFFMTADSTVGLLDRNGKTIIKPMEYDEISILDEVKQLYLVKKDSKYGVLNRKGDVVVHVDYDRIGLKDIDKFGTNIEKVRNTNLLFDECIIVGLDSKYGMFDITGKELLKPNYETFGYTTVSTDTSGEASTLIIPEETGIKGIVVCYDGLYGIYDANVKNLIIPCACSRIYSITMAGKTTYYMEFNGDQMELDSYLVTYNLKNGGNKSNQVQIDTENNIVEDSENTEQETTTEETSVPETLELEENNVQEAPAVETELE